MSEERPQRSRQAPSHLAEFVDEKQKEILESPKAKGKKAAEIVNHDQCDSCGLGGDLLCCDSCPCSFHVVCIEPPLPGLEVPDEDWFCTKCTAKKEKKKGVIKHPHRLFGGLMDDVAKRNPECFLLPEWIIQSDVKAAATKKVKATRKQAKSPERTNSTYCTACGLSNQVFPCDICPRSFHPTCLNPPLRSPLPSNWVCPEHQGDINAYQGRLEAHRKLKRRRLGEAPPGKRAFVTDPVRLDFMPSDEKATGSGNSANSTTAAVSARGIPVFGRSTEFVPTYEEQREWLATVSNLQANVQRDVATEEIARLATSSMEGAETEAQLIRLLQAQQEAYNQAVGDSTDPESKANTAFSPSAVEEYISPLFTQFLAWQRLNQITNDLKKMQTKLRTTEPVAAAALTGDVAMTEASAVNGVVDTTMTEVPDFIAKSEKPLARVAGNGFYYTMETNSITIGRRPLGANILAYDIDIDLGYSAKGVSQMHACIFLNKKTGRLELINYGKNGTTVNGQKVMDHATLPDTCTLGVGQYTMTFTYL